MLKKWMFMTGLLLMAARASAQVEMEFFQKSTAQTRSATAAASATDARENELYNDGTQYMNESKWDQAVAKFDEAAKLRGRRSEGALYWKAFSQSKLGNQSGALASCADLRKTYPQSRWLKECGALEIQLRGGSRGEESASSEDDDLKLLALNQLMDRDEERALPLVEKFLNNTRSERLRERALFVLAQSQSPKAQQIIGDIARGKSHPELQEKAVQYIGIHGGRRGLDTLAEIYASSNSIPVKRKILQAYGISDDRAHLLTAARSETNSDLQRAAVQGLGVAGAKQELRQLYQETKSSEMKSHILDAMIVDGDDEYFAQVAKSEQDPALRRKAIRGIGISGGRGAGPALVAIYQQYQDPETKRAALEGLFVSDNAKALVDLARQEKDRDMRRRIVEKLSVMDSKEARDYMFEILER
jgi:HEAT repeat protein